MDLVNVAIGGMLVTTVWALWIRRHTWRMYWENAATATLALQIGAVLLGMPLTSNTLGAWLESVTGHGHLTEWASSMCCLGSTASFTLHKMIRLRPLTELVRKDFHKYVNLPLTFTVPVTLALLWYSPAADRDTGQLIDAHCGTKLAAYWLLIAATQLWLVRLLWRMLRILRQDKRSRYMCTLYMWACALSVLSIGARVVTLAEDDPVHAPLMWLFGSLSVGVFAWGCGRSWQSKLHYDAMHEQMIREEAEAAVEVIEKWLPPINSKKQDPEGNPT